MHPLTFIFCPANNFTDKFVFLGIEGNRLDQNKAGAQIAIKAMNNGKEDQQKVIINSDKGFAEMTKLKAKNEGDNPRF